MRMCTLSNAIREKPNWWEKIKDPALVEKWKQEALDQQKDEYHFRKLTERMVTAAKSFALTGIDLVRRSIMCSKNCMGTRQFETLTPESR